MKPVKKYKLSRRLQTPLFEKCQSQKFIIREQRREPKKRRRTVSEYGKQLAEKQKVRYLYGISEKVLKRYVKQAMAVKGVTTETLLGETLERRLDNVVYRLGLAPTRRMARQLVSHGHFTVNGRKVTIPSRRIVATDVIGVREGSTTSTLFKQLLATSIRPTVPWLTWDPKAKQGSLSGVPTGVDDIFSLAAILEYYSR